MLQLRRMCYVMLLLMLPFALLCCRTTEQAQNRTSDEAAIRGQVAAMEAAYNKRDTAALAAIYATDGDVMMVAGPRSSGHEAIRRATETDWAKMPSTRQISLTVDSIRFLSSDVAIAECTARLSEGEPSQDRGTWVMVRRDGTWRVAALRVLPAEQR